MKKLRTNGSVIRRFLAILTAAVMVLSVFTVSAEGEKVRVCALKGPTGIGLVHVMEDSEAYDFTLCGSPDEAVAAIVSGSVDIAAIPTNLASVLYNKTKGNIRLLGLNTLGVLYILERGDTVHSAADLAGKTLYATGQAAVPEYVMNYILDANGLTGKTEIQYAGEHAELATLAAAGERDLVLLPEPYVTAVLMKNPEFRVALDVTELYDSASSGEAVLSMGCIVARAAFAEEHPEKVEAFLTRYADSVEKTNGDPETAGQLAESFGVMPNGAVVTRAIPNCHIVLIRGEEMKESIVPFFEMLKASAPGAVGGELPEDDFYYGCGR